MMQVFLQVMSEGVILPIAYQPEGSGYKSHDNGPSEIEFFYQRSVRDSSMERGQGSAALRQHRWEIGIMTKGKHSKDVHTREQCSKIAEQDDKVVSDLVNVSKPPPP